MAGSSASVSVTASLTDSRLQRLSKFRSRSRATRSRPLRGSATSMPTAGDEDAAWIRPSLRPVRLTCRATAWRLDRPTTQRRFARSRTPSTPAGWRRTPSSRASTGSPATTTGCPTGAVLVGGDPPGGAPVVEAPRARRCDGRRHRRNTPGRGSDARVLPAAAAAAAAVRCGADAERRLGSRFVLPEFHAAVLDSGSLPMPVLADKLRRWSAVQGSL